VIVLAAIVKLQQFVISEPNEVYHQSRAAIQQLTAAGVASNFVLTTQELRFSSDYGA